MLRRSDDLDLRALVAKFLITMAALWVADALVSGIRIGGWQSYAAMAVVFGLANAFAKPFLTFITCPLIVLTLGLFLLVLNAAIFGLSAWVAAQAGADVTVAGFGAALLGAVIVSVTTWLLSLVVG